MNAKLKKEKQPKNSFKAEFEQISSLNKLHSTAKNDLLETASTNILREISFILNSEELATKDKISFLMEISASLSENLEHLTPKIPEEAPSLWESRGRKNRNMSPCDFVIENYSSYGYGLTMADIRKLDPKLYSALKNWKSKIGWPDEFNLPTREQFYNEIIEQMSSEKIEEFSRIYDAIRNRKRRNAF